MQNLITIPQGVYYLRMRETAHQKRLLGFFGFFQRPTAEVPELIFTQIHQTTRFCRRMCLFGVRKHPSYDCTKYLQISPTMLETVRDRQNHSYCGTLIGRHRSPSTCVGSNDLERQDVSRHFVGGSLQLCTNSLTYDDQICRHNSCEEGVCFQESDKPHLKGRGLAPPKKFGTHY